jgi:hypothetical protein
MAGWLGDELRHAGILPDDASVYIRTGSQANGQAWKLGTGPDGHDQVPGFPEYLGWTGAEAEGRCRAILDTLHACKAVRMGDDWHARRRADISERVAAAAARKAERIADAQQVTA